MPNFYTAGQVIEFTAAFADDNGNPIDPTAVTFKYQVGTATPVTLTYSGTSVPAVGIVARTATGNYEAQVDTTNLAGDWTVEWKSTGAGQTVGAQTLTVHPAPI